MKILSRRGEKDYYDYLVSIMGMDEKVVYDRKNSTVVGESEYYSFDYPFGYDLYFSRKPFKEDTTKIKKTVWQSCKFKNRNGRYTLGWKARNKEEEYEGTIYHLLLEIGYKHFIFEIERYLDESGKVNLDISIVDTYTVPKGKKLSKEPLYICKWYLGYLYRRGGENREGIDNPILKNTWIPSLISAQDMWNMLYEYISSLNDKEFTDTRTNDQHIESHGFDKKISFRHRKR